MIDYLGLILPGIIFLKALYNYFSMYKLVSDKGELLYTFKKEENNKWWGLLFMLIVFSIFGYLMISKIDSSSFYIYEKYFSSPLQLFDSDHYYTTRDILHDTNQFDFESYENFKDMVEDLPLLISLILSILSDLIFKFYKEGIYSNGIIVTKQFLNYDVIRSYEFVEQNDRTNLKLVVNQTGMFSNDYKDVEILIHDDEIKEIEAYLRHEIQAFSKVESLDEAS